MYFMFIDLYMCVCMQLINRSYSTTTSFTKVSISIRPKVSISSHWAAPLGFSQHIHHKLLYFYGSCNTNITSYTTRIHEILQTQLQIIPSKFGSFSISSLKFQFFHFHPSISISCFNVVLLSSGLPLRPQYGIVLNLFNF